MGCRRSMGEISINCLILLVGQFFILLPMLDSPFVPLEFGRDLTDLYVTSSDL